MSARFVSHPSGMMAEAGRDVIAQRCAEPGQLQTLIQSEQELAAVFAERIVELNKQNGRDMRKHPRVGHKELDFYALYKAVQAAGGYLRVGQWKDIGKALNIPSSVTNVGFTLRSKYESFLRPFEDILAAEFPLEFGTARLQQNGRQRGEVQVIAAERANNWLQTRQESQKQFTQLTPGQQQIFISEQIQHQLNSMKNQAQAQPPIFKKKFTSSIKKLRLVEMNPTDEQFQNLLSSNPCLEQLELGSMRGLTRVPAQFPPNLRQITLHDLPNRLVHPFMEALAAYPIEEMDFRAYEEKSPAPKPQAIAERQPSFAYVGPLAGASDSFVQNDQLSFSQQGNYVYQNSLYGPNSVGGSLD